MYLTKFQSWFVWVWQVSFSRHFSNREIALHDRQANVMKFAMVSTLAESLSSFTSSGHVVLNLCCVGTLNLLELVLSIFDCWTPILKLTGSGHVVTFRVGFWEEKKSEFFQIWKCSHFFCFSKLGAPVFRFCLSRPETSISGVFWARPGPGDSSL